jgi:hypothetical protein
MWFRKKKAPEGKTAWSQVPVGDVPALADALKQVVDNAKMLGIDPAGIRMAPIRQSVDGLGAPVWRLSFSITDQAWALRGYPTDQVSEDELRRMTAQEVSGALRAGRLKGLLI